MFSEFRQRISQLQRDQQAWQSLLTEQEVQQACLQEDYHAQAKLYTPLQTLLIFLGQLLSPDGSCQQAVDELLARQATLGQETASANTGGYCRARARLPEAVIERLMRQSGQTPQDEAPQDWHWKNHRVRIADGSTLKIADTPANRNKYPLQKGLTEGLHYPVVRILVVFSLAVGTVLEAALREYQGKGTGETAMLRELAEEFCVNDVLLADRYYAGWWDIFFWWTYGVHLVTVLPKSRRADFRRGRRLGKKDHLVHWKRPARPDWVEAELSDGAPRTLTLRELEITVKIPGFRVQKLVIVTTLTDAERYSVEELGQLYRLRWQAELNLRSLKTQLGMEFLSGRTPEMVRKEFRMYLLAYNCIRRVASVAAWQQGILPREVSFTQTRQTLNAYFPLWGQVTNVDHWLMSLLKTILQIRVGQRPNRASPRQCKLRPKDYGPLKEGQQRYLQQKT